MIDTRIFKINSEKAEIIKNSPNFCNQDESCYVLVVEKSLCM